MIKMTWFKKFKHKFGAKPQKLDEKHFASKLEAAYYKRLKNLQVTGHIIFFLRQVPFELPGNTKYFIDFVEFWENGDIVFTECKGFETAIYKIKKKLFEENYPIEINVVRKV